MLSGNKRIVVGLAVLSGLFFLVCAINYFSARAQTETLIGQERQLSSEFTAIVALNDRLAREGGFGGAIPAFQNYVMRGDETSASRAAMKLEQTQRVLDELAAAETATATLNEPLAVLNQTFIQYEANLAVARSLWRDGAPVSEIEARVRVDDSGAIRALDELANAARSRADQLSALSVAIQESRDESVAWLHYALLLAALWIVSLAWTVLRRSAERRQSLARYERANALLQRTKDAIVEVDSDHKIVSFNGSACALFGYDKDAVIGQPLDMLLDQHDPALHREQMSAFLRGENVSDTSKRLMENWRQMIARRADGSSFPLQLSLSRFTYDGASYGSAVMRDMTEEEKDRRITEDRLRALEQASRQKSEFLANMSHELRTPLNAIIGFSEMIAARMDKKISEASVEEYAGIIRSSGEHLLVIVNNILDLARVESNKINISLVRFSPVEAVQACIDMMMNTPVRRGHAIVQKIDRTMGDFSGDQHLLQQILLNLLTNSCKFSAPGSRIEVWLSLSSDRVLEMQVRDQGVGIPEHMIAEVTKPFIQVENAYSRSHDGVGLGLSLVSQFVSLLKGTMKIESNCDQGTTIIIRLPEHKAKEKMEVEPLPQISSRPAKTRLKVV